jgi:hypothetical protein
METWIYFTTLGLILGTVLLVFGMRYRAQMRLADAQSSAQTETVAALGAIQTALADVKTRLAAVEKMLKDVG